jgi:taurine dioxygenase
MSERLTITLLGPYIGAQVSGLDVTCPLSDNQFEQLYHAVLRHQVVFLREQAIIRSSSALWRCVWRPAYSLPSIRMRKVEEIIVLDTHNDNPPDNDNWHTDVTLSRRRLPGRFWRRSCYRQTGGDTLWASGIRRPLKRCPRRSGRC